MNKQKLLILLLAVTGFSFANAKNNQKPVILNGTTEQPRIVMTGSYDLSMHLPQLAGIFRLGLISGDKSVWLNDIPDSKSEYKNGNIQLTFKNIFNKNSQLIVKISRLSPTDGFIMATESFGLPENTQLCWAFGAGYGKEIPDKMNTPLLPEYCKDNVFSVEGSAFTLYYGESMKLKVVQGVTPPTSDIRLSDARKQTTPLEFCSSGKKTDTPALSGVFSLQPNEKYYFCFYLQNKDADYNYYMLPDLFTKEYQQK